MRKLALSCVAVLILCGISFAAGPVDELLKADRDWCKAIAEQRLEGFMAHLAPNIVLFGDANGITGPDAVRAYEKQEFDNPTFQLTWEATSAKMFPSGTMGTTEGKFHVRFSVNGKETAFSGTYLTVWQKQKDGTWKVAADGGAPDPPPTK
ncbi:MAG TPA: nuclear transport factor 2 family protein [Candidatus Koribacter sp.]|jgi:ketosteroid isomerase-like protein